MRVPLVILAIGALMLIGGIILAIAAPATVTWQPKSDVLARDEIVRAPAAWESKSGVLADKEIIKVPATWESKNQTLLLNQVVEAPSFLAQSYGYALAFIPLAFEEVRENKYTMEGYAVETSGYGFDFYVFDETNYDLWKAGRAYTAYVEVKSVAEHHFNFTLIKPKDVTITFYFVVDSSLLLKRVVKVSATASWFEKAFFTYPGEFHPFVPFIVEAKDFIVEGNATEVAGQKFNFYIFNKVNCDLWKAGLQYTSYFEAKDTATTSFSFPLKTKNEVYDLYFAVERSEFVDRTVTLSATIKWAEKTPFLTPAYLRPLVSPTIEEAKDFVIKGDATETGGNKFNFYALDGINYQLHTSGKTFTPYFEAKEVTTTHFSFPLNKKEDVYDLYFLVENVDLTDKTVKISATLEWNEKATIAATIGGLVLGGIIALLGIVVIIIAGVLALILKPKENNPLGAH